MTGPESELNLFPLKAFKWEEPEPLLMIQVSLFLLSRDEGSISYEN